MPMASCMTGLCVIGIRCMKIVATILKLLINTATMNEPKNVSNNMNILPFRSVAPCNAKKDNIKKLNNHKLYPEQDLSMIIFRFW